MAEMSEMYVMHLPHFKDERSYKLWLEEVYDFKDYVEKFTGNKITEEKLKDVITSYSIHYTKLYDKKNHQSI